MKKLTLLRHAPSLLLISALVALSSGALALADTIYGDANTAVSNIQGSIEKAPGSTGDAKFALVVDDNPTDPQNGCNASGNTRGDKPPVVLNVSSDRGWLTLTQSSITLTGCDDADLTDLAPAAQVNYQVAAGAPAGDTATVTASYASGGAAGGTYTPGSFQVKTPAASDTTPPVVTPTVIGTVGDNGWYTSDVTVSFSVTDAQSAVSSRSAGCAGGSVTSDTSGVSFTCTATSAGGTSSETVTVKRDATAPSITLRPAGNSCDTPGDNGWCRGTQTAGFRATDATSGLVAGESPYDFTQSTGTNGGTVSISSGTLKDKAGNEATAIDAGPFKIDSVEPTLSLRPLADTCETPGNGGWCRGTQTAGFQASDDTSGLPQGASPYNFSKSTSANGDAVVVSSGAVKDNAGNETAAVDAGPYKIDNVKPLITSRPDGDSCAVPGDNGWCRDAQTAGFTAHDGTSGLVDADGDPLSSPYDFTQSAIVNGTAVEIASGTVADAAGNVATEIKAGPYKIDSVRPSLVLRPAGDSCDVPGDDSWCRGTQTAGFRVTDVTSGPAGGPSPYDFTNSTTTNGSAVLISSGAIEDNAGNETAAIDAGPYKIDSLSPGITGSASPAPNSAGWNRTDVQVTFSCGDGAGSGVAACGPDVTLSNEGRGQEATGTASDAAGNSATATVSGINIDRTGPSAPTAAFDKAKAYTDADGVDWYKDSVAVSFKDSADPDLHDDRDGVANKTGSGVTSYSGATSKTTSGTLSYSGVATDRADNDSGATTGAVKVDAGNASVTIDGCPTGKVLLGASVSITVTATDAESGLASDPSGTLSLDTGTVGTKTRTVTAGDNVGHEQTKTCAYGVVFDFTGFLAPIDNPVTGKMNGVKAGSSVPVKFKLGGYQGLDVLAAGYPKAATIPCGNVPIDPVAESELISAYSTNTNGLTYDILSGEYSYIWKTDKSWAGSCRQLVVKLVDGEPRFVNFKSLK